MYSIAVLKINEMDIVELPKPEVGPYDVLVKTKNSGICNATDRKLIHGQFPGIGPDWYPLLIGHESAGIVKAVGEKVTSFHVGDKALGGLLFYPTDNRFKSAWGGNSEYTIIVDHKAMVRDGVADENHGWREMYMVMKKIPEDISFEDACMLYTWREVYSGMVFDFKITRDDAILLFGAGAVGLSFIKIAKIMGLKKVICVDPLPEKREKAILFGADDVFSYNDEIYKIIFEKHGKFNKIIDAVGNESIINCALPLLTMGGSVCVFGVVTKPNLLIRNNIAPLNFNIFFHQLPTKKTISDSHEILIDWVRKGYLDSKDFITGRYSIRDFKKAMETTQSNSTLKTIMMFD